MISHSQKPRLSRNTDVCEFLPYFKDKYISLIILISLPLHYRPTEVPLGHRRLQQIRGSGPGRPQPRCGSPGTRPPYVGYPGGGPDEGPDVDPCGDQDERPYGGPDEGPYVDPCGGLNEDPCGGPCGGLNVGPCEGPDEDPCGDHYIHHPVKRCRNRYAIQN